MLIRTKTLICFMLACSLSSLCFCQYNNNAFRWNREGNAYYKIEDQSIVQISLPGNQRTVVAARENLIPQGSEKPLNINGYSFSQDHAKLLIYTNTKKVWRYNTRGDYWVYDFQKKSLTQLGKSLAASSLMFAKFSPDGKKAAYVFAHNLYVEDLETGAIKQLSADGTRKLINGTFDWAYEEEFDCRDGFRWSPDSRHIAYWQIDAKETRDYLMINNTDSVYSRAIPVEYPVAGELPSPYRIGVMDIETAHTVWMDIPTDPVLGTYVPRMAWADNDHELIIQHLNRKQNLCELFMCNTTDGSSRIIYTDRDSAWIDVFAKPDENNGSGGWIWLKEGKEFLWESEKDGWRHLYLISRDGKKETLLTPGNFDVMDIACVDEKGGYLYYGASPANATQKYLYRTGLDGKGRAQLLTPAGQAGTHNYTISPNAKFALHKFTNYFTPAVSEWISLPDQSPLEGNKISQAVQAADSSKSNTSFFKIKTAEGIEMDGWMVKPDNFDPSKKYPVVFYVYTEPAGQNVKDEYGIGKNNLYRGNMAADGYIYISIDNRGTPVPKGRIWRKCIYRKIGQINISDQAAAAREVLKWPFVDSSRVAVWGWSGGGSATLNLMFQFPDIYKTGIAIAAVGNQLTYDNIYQERYMGLPQENRGDFVKGSPISYAKNLKGNLLYIHGTGDDNVHYDNAEMLLNELVRYNRQFQFMAYPNRTHNISEGEGTSLHLSTLYTDYLKSHCPGGGR